MADDTPTPQQGRFRTGAFTLDSGEACAGVEIGCPVLWLLAASDVLLTPADLIGAEAWWPNARVEVIETGWGYVAPAAPPGSPEFEFFDQRTAAFLAALTETAQ
jgi:hypothetical protein